LTIHVLECFILFQKYLEKGLWWWDNGGDVNNELKIRRKK